MPATNSTKYNLNAAFFDMSIGFGGSRTHTSDYLVSSRLFARCRSFAAQPTTSPLAFPGLLVTAIAAAAAAAAVSRG